MIAAILTLALFAPSYLPEPDYETRKSTPKDLALEVERYVLPNGLVVLLAPDPSSASVLVDMTFYAGAIYEPPGKGGLAHLVEHVMMSGTTPDTDYIAMLERRGARSLNAFTNTKTMVFRSIVAPRELPLALWVHADRAGALPKLLSAENFERERRVVAAERVERYLDVPYGQVELAIHSKIFPAPHPLSQHVIGLPEELDRATLADARTFIDRTLVASNAILTLIGNFDPALAKTWIEKTVGTLPVRARPAEPERPKGRPAPIALTFREELSRRPRVSMIWRLDSLSPDATYSLSFGAELLSNYLDGAFGTEIDARLFEQDGEGFFRLDVTLPHEKPIDSAEKEAEVFLRYLTAVDMPRDVFQLTRLARDRRTMFMLDTLEGRAYLLNDLEVRFGRITSSAEHHARHWKIARHDVQHTAWKTLITKGQRMIFHARPTKPLQPKLDWDER